MSQQNIITIIDYGSGNLRSAAKAFEHVADGAIVRVSADPKDVLSASHIVLPGQGAFGDCMMGLSAIEGMLEALHQSVQEKKKPFLGICVGMQLLADEGLEFGSHQGLGWISGQVVPIVPQRKNTKIPHMGWNSLIINDHSDVDMPAFVRSSAISGLDFYFVHSYVYETVYNNIYAHTEYDQILTAIVGHENILGVQFHPEKSQEAGLELIKGFTQWKP